jgi:hypothetical protein
MSGTFEGASVAAADRAQRLRVAADIFLRDEILLVVTFDTLRSRKR